MHGHVQKLQNVQDLEKSNRMLFMKKNNFLHNRLSIVAAYYIMALVLFCGAKAPKDPHKIWTKAIEKEWAENKKSKNSVLFKDVTVGEEVLKAVPSDAKDFADQAWNAYGDEMIIGMSFFEDFIKEPRVLKGERRATYGPGLTYVFDMDSKKIEQHACSGVWRDIAAKFTTEDIWEQFRMCCIHNLFSKYGLQRAIKGYDLDGRAQVALCYAGYQSPSSMKAIAKEYSKAITIQEKMDAFLANVPRRTARGVKISTGSLKRRWWCAAYAVGIISSEDLMSVSCASYASIALSKVYENGHFKYDEETVQYALDKARSDSSQTIAESLNDFEMGQSVIARREIMNTFDVFGKDNLFFASDNANKTQSFKKGVELVRNKSQIRPPLKNNEGNYL